MYLETTRAVGRVYRDPTSCPVGQKLVPYTATTRYGAVSRGVSCIRDPDYVSPTAQSFDLVGTPTSWSYQSCPSGYRRKLSGKPHPNYYTCFASTAAQVSAPVQNKCAPVRWSCSDGTQRMANSDARPPDCDPCSAVGLRGKII